MALEGRRIACHVFQQYLSLQDGSTGKGSCASSSEGVLKSFVFSGVFTS
jgi:hypothetical protein